MNVIIQKQVEKYVSQIIKTYNLTYPQFNIKSFILNCLGGSITVLNDESVIIKDYITTKTGNETFNITIKQPKNNINPVEPSDERFNLSYEVGKLVIEMGFLSINREKWDNILIGAKHTWFDNQYNKPKGPEIVNEFAGALLLPKEIFIEKLKEHADENNLCDLKIIADYFEVTYQLVNMRGKNLKLWK